MPPRPAAASRYQGIPLEEHDSLTPVNIHIDSAHRRVDRKIAPRQIRPAREHLLSAHSKLIQARVLQCDAVEFSRVNGRGQSL